MSSELQERKDEEYEMQLLGFTSRSVYTIVENIAAAKLQSGIKKLCKCLEKMNNEEENSAAVIRNDEENLTKLYFSRCKPHKEVVKKCIRELIAVPKNILLQEDTCQRIQYSEKELQKIEEDLRTLQSQARSATIFRAALQEELDQLAEFDPLIQDADMIYSVIENSTMYTTVNEDTIKCIETCKALDEDVEKSITNVLF